MLIGSVGTVESVQEASLRRAATTVLPVVEFDHIDAQDALRWLFRRALIGGTLSPNVHGTVTLSLRNVVWETTLCEMTRQIEATSRFDRGWLQIVGKDEGLVPEDVRSIPYHPFDDSRNSELAEGYQSINTGVALGRGRDIHRLLSPSFRMREAGGVSSGASAVRRLVEIQRNYPLFDSTGLRYGKGGYDTADVQAIYSRPDGRRVFYHDFWRADSRGTWRLFLRDGVVRNSSIDFRATLLSKVLESAGKRYGVEFSLDPSIDRPIDFDLTGLDLDIFLDLLEFRDALTHRIEGGKYRIVEANGLSLPGKDLANERIPFAEFWESDIRVALSWLFQKIGARYRFDPKVKGLVNVSLRNVTFEIALQNMVRQADATYRIGNGLYEVVPRDPKVRDESVCPPTDFPADPNRQAIEVEYGLLAGLANTGKASDLSFRLGKRFRWIDAPTDSARSFLALAQAFPRFDIVEIGFLPEQSGIVERRWSKVRYASKDGLKARYFWDQWEKEKEGWRLVARESVKAQR